MARPDGQKARLCRDGKRSFIQVAPGHQARALHAHLRRNHICCDPPDPCTTDYDVIELRAGSDIETVQAALDGWK
jgi:hypothetical protein